MLFRKAAVTECSMALPCARALTGPFTHQHEWCPISGMGLIRCAPGDRLGHGTA